MMPFMIIENISMEMHDRYINSVPTLKVMESRWPIFIHPSLDILLFVTLWEINHT